MAASAPDIRHSFVFRELGGEEVNLLVVEKILGVVRSRCDLAAETVTRIPSG